MEKILKLKEFLDRTTSIFKEKKELSKIKNGINVSVIRLNFFLLNAALKMIQKGGPTQPFSFFTTKILDSKNKHFLALVQQAEKVCSKQDIELFSYKAFYCKNHFVLHKAVQWHLLKYIKTKKRMINLVDKTNEPSPGIFKRHLVTFILKEGNFSVKIEKKAEQLKEKYDIWRYESVGSSSISPL